MNATAEEIKEVLRALLASAYDAGYLSALDDPNRTRTDEEIDALCDRFGYEEIGTERAAYILAAARADRR